MILSLLNVCASNWLNSLDIRADDAYLLSVLVCFMFCLIVPKLVQIGGELVNVCLQNSWSSFGFRESLLKMMPMTHLLRVGLVL